RQIDPHRIRDHHQPRGPSGRVTNPVTYPCISPVLLRLTLRLRTAESEKSEPPICHTRRPPSETHGPGMTVKKAPIAQSRQKLCAAKTVSSTRRRWGRPAPTARHLTLGRREVRKSQAIGRRGPSSAQELEAWS